MSPRDAGLHGGFVAVPDPERDLLALDSRGVHATIAARMVEKDLAAAQVA